MSGVSGLPVVPQYLAIAADEQTYVQRAEKSDPTTQAQIAYFKTAAPTITSPTALLANYRVLQVVLGAFGMSADINDTGLLKELMTQNPQSSSSLAKTLASPIDLRFAQAFSNWTTSPLASSAEGYVFSGTTSSAALPGATTLQLTSVAGLQLGQTVADTTSAAALASGTLITAINTSTNTITLSGATASAVGKGDALTYGLPQFIAAAPALIGSDQLTLGSTSGVAVGDYLTSVNGAAPTTSGAAPKITAISGNTITLSAGLPSSVSINGTLTFAPAPIASVATAQAAGSSTLQLTSLTGVRVGQVVSATAGAIPAGTTVTAINAADNTVTLSHSLAAATTPAEQITFTDIPTTISNPVSTIAAQFQTNAFEHSEGTTSGLQQALYFTRTIASSTTLAQMMSDPTQLQVLEVATGQPAAFGELDYNQQVAILTKAVDVSKFSNPAYVTQYVERYLVLNQISPPSPPTTYSIATLFGGSGSSSGGSSASDILSLFA